MANNNEMMETTTEIIETAVDNNDGSILGTILTIGGAYIGCRIIERGVMGLVKAGKKKLENVKAKRLEKQKEDEVIVTTEVEDIEATYKV